MKNKRTSLRNEGSLHFLYLFNEHICTIKDFGQGCPRNDTYGIYFPKARWHEQSVSRCRHTAPRYHLYAQIQRQHHEYFFATILLVVSIIKSNMTVCKDIHCRCFVFGIPPIRPQKAISVVFEQCIIKYYTTNSGRYARPGPSIVCAYAF